MYSDVRWRFYAEQTPRDHVSPIQTSYLGMNPLAVFFFMVLAVIGLAVWIERWGGPERKLTSSERKRIARQKLRERRKQKRKSRPGNKTKRPNMAEAKAERERVALAQEHSTEVLVDCSFCERQSATEVGSLAVQLCQLWSFHRRTPHPLRLGVCGLTSEPLKEKLLTAGADRWTLPQHEGPVNAVAARDAIVYLSPDAEEELEVVLPGTTYVIGGIVDKTILKGMSKSRAGELGVRSMRLPLRTARPGMVKDVLNVDTVYRLLATVAAGRTWAQAMDEHVPLRNAKRLTHVDVPRTRPRIDGMSSKRLGPVGTVGLIRNAARKHGDDVVELHVAEVNVDGDAHGVPPDQAAALPHAPWTPAVLSQASGHGFLVRMSVRCDKWCPAIAGAAGASLGDLAYWAGDRIVGEGWAPQKTPATNRAGCFVIAAMLRVDERAALAALREVGYKGN